LSSFRNLSLSISEKQLVALVGPNGAGKTTTLNAISGILRIYRGRVSRGFIEFMGRRIENGWPGKVARLGVVHVMDGRRVFPELTVEENLRLVSNDVDLAYEYFPRLRERRGVRAGYLSGGEQQMLVIARALLRRPRLILLDEPSLGLAPIIVEQLFKILKEINQKENITILLAEQNAIKAFEVADYAYVMDTGRVVREGKPEELMEDRDIKEFLLGLSEKGRVSYREVKAYKRRKRWFT